MKLWRRAALLSLVLLLTACHPPVNTAKRAQNAAVWVLERLDLDLNLRPAIGEIHFGGLARLRRERGVSRELVLRLDPPMRFTAPPRVVGEQAQVSLFQQGARARLRLPAERRAGAALQVRFEYANREPRGPSFAVDLSGAYAASDRAWHPVPFGAQPGTVRPVGRTTLRLPLRWQALASGTQPSSMIVSGVRVSTWEATRPTARSFAAGHYQVARANGAEGEQLAVYLGPSRSGQAERYVAVLGQLLGALTRSFGTYPLEGFNVAEVAPDLASWRKRAEHGMLLVGAARLDRAQRPDAALLARAVTRTWWSQRGPAQRPDDRLVDEAMVQYGAVLAVEALQGPVAARRLLRFSSPASSSRSARGYFELWRKGKDRPLAKPGAGVDDLAGSKGAWVLSMLRRRTGDALFFKTLRGLARTRVHLPISLDNLRHTFVAAAPAEADLQRFFAQWLDRPGAPVLEQRWEAARGPRGAHQAVVTVRQLTTPYQLRLKISVGSTAGARTHQVTLSEREQRFTLDAAGPPTTVTLDPDHELLRWHAHYGPRPKL